MNNKQVAEFFVEQQVLQPSQAEDVLTEVDLNGKSIAQAMVDGGFVDESGFYQRSLMGLERIMSIFRLGKSRRKSCV